MHVHVFTVDTLPFEGLICSGGGLRSWQFVNGLRQRGAEVTYSMPAGATLVRQQWDRFTAEQRESCYSHEKGHRLIDIINRFKPDAAVVLWPLAFANTSNLKDGMITVFDINGFQNVESALFQRNDFQEETRKYLQKIRGADILVAGSSEQRAYWGGLLGYHYNKLTPTEMIDIPFSLDRGLIGAAVEKKYESGGPLFFCTGTFLPWNSPQGHLTKLARLIAAAGRGELLVVGRPILSEAYSGEVLRELEAVAQYPFARIESGTPFQAMVETIARRGVAIDLHLPTFEREFALPVRTMTYLGAGMPVVFNNYSTLATQVKRYGAGFCIDPGNEQEFENVIGRILSECDDVNLARMSDAALRLMHENYDDNSGMQCLLDRMEEKLLKARTARTPPTASTTIRDTRSPAASVLSPFVARLKLPRVLVISDEHENLLNVRVHMPFRAMQEQQLIDDYIVMARGQLVKREEVSQQLRDIDVVWVQRRPRTAPLFAPALFGERFVLDLDDILLLSPSYRPPFTDEWTAMVRALLRSAGTVTTPGPRLVDAVQRHSGVAIEHKSVIAPNMTASVHAKNIASPTALLLACSDHLPMTNSKEPFLRAVRRFTELRGLPLLYLGPSVNDFKGIAHQTHALGVLRYQHYLQVLRSEPLIGVVPLEAHGDPITDDFICGKSDIKMVEFGAASIPAVYSRVAPYSDSPLQIGPVADFSDTGALLEALDLVFTDADRQGRLAHDRVREQRLASDVAHQWYEAIERERMSHAVSLELIQTQATRYTRFLAGTIPAPAEFDEANYVKTYPDVVEWAESTEQSIYEHYLRYGQREERSWHIGDPGVNIEHTAATARELVSTLETDWRRLDERVAAALGEQRREPPRTQPNRRTIAVEGSRQHGRSTRT